MNENVLVEYVKDRNGHRLGAVVGLVVEKDGELESRVGWSRCNKKDKYDNDAAIAVAIGRAQVDRSFALNKEIPRDVQKVYDRMLLRTARYFKGVPMGVSLDLSDWLDAFGSRNSTDE